MALRAGHGKGAGQPRVEVLPADEQADPAPGAPEPIVRRRDGTVASPEAGQALGRLAAEKRAARSRLVTGLGIRGLAADAAFRPFQVAGEDWVRTHLAELALQAGGRVGPGPASIVQSAGLQLAASRYLFEQASQSGDPAIFKAASQLADGSRQNQLAAYELATREAKARQASEPSSPEWMISEGAG